MVWEGGIRPLDYKEKGAQMGKDAKPGGFSGQRISLTLVKIRIGCPGCV